MLNKRRQEIRIKADDFREKCKVSRYGIIDLFKECDRCGYKLIRYPNGTNGDLGFALKKDKDIIIYTNSSSRLSREIFTLAHEIGHIILHMENTASFIDNDMTISEKNTDEKEQEANYFAACLLMPKDVVDKFFDLELEDYRDEKISIMDIARIMSEFSVSFEMALNRLESLDKISADEKVIFDNEKNIMRVGNLLKSVGGNSRLNEPSQETVIPYEYIDYVIYNYNHDAIPRETLEKALSCYNLKIDDISDRLKETIDDEDDLDELIGGLED